jgi:hypothetical protein
VQPAFGIQVTLVEPGNVSTDFTASRRTSATATGPLYGSAFTKALGVMERDEVNGAPASQIASVVRRVLETRHPLRRVSAGKPAERVGLLAKRLLPFRLFQAAARGALGV